MVSDKYDIRSSGITHGTPIEITQFTIQILLINVNTNRNIFMVHFGGFRIYCLCGPADCFGEKIYNKSKYYMKILCKIYIYCEGCDIIDADSAICV